MSGLRKILITRNLSGSQLELARKLGLEPLIEPSIRFEFPDVERQVRNQLEKNPHAPWVFTSKNGVRAFQSFSGEWIAGRRVIYAVGKKTREALGKLGYEARTPERQDAVGLAEQILQDLSDRDVEKLTVLHWCGNLSRPTLQEKLEEGGVKLIRLEVYRTLLNQMEIPDDPGEGILFFSPSSVESFRKSGGFQKPLPELFAIGNTTGELLSMESGRPVHIPRQPATEALLELAADVLTGTGVR